MGFQLQIIKGFFKKISIEQKFMISAFLVNIGNYVYNLLLGRILGPEQFSDAAILITLLLVLSFVGMTFQLVTTKFSVLFEKEIFQDFIAIIYKYALVIGLVLGVLVIIFSKNLQQLFFTQSKIMFVVFGVGIPIYFIVSVNRGVLQGRKQFVQLATTYQSEMISRLLITLILLFLWKTTSSTIIALGVSLSLLFGLLPFSIQKVSFLKKISFPKKEQSQIRKFFTLTAFYELTQIIINNSDILMVKHFFNAFESGLYSSLALIGRAVYFVAWMFVMLLLPQVVQLHKEGKQTAPLLFKYIGYIIILSTGIILGCFLFPNFAIQVLFGSEYLEIAPLLWKYAIATSLFAISNIFAYYFLSLDRYIPVILSGIMGITQIALIVLFHNSLVQVVHVQIIAMMVLFIIQLVYFFGFNTSNHRSFPFTNSSK